MRKEVKDILGILAIAVPMCALVFVWWFNSPMYAEVQAQQRVAAQSLLRQTYYFGEYGPVEIDRQELMEKYGITDEDIKPDGVLKEFSGTQNEESNQQPGNPAYALTGVWCFAGVLGVLVLYDWTKRKRRKPCDE